MALEPRRRFKFLKEISEGSFGKVYLAEMLTGDNFSTVVAIKLLHGKWLGNEEIVMRSRDEARLLGLLRHQNIIRVEDLTSINGQCAIVMEYLDGVDLKYLITYLTEKGEVFPRKAVLEVGVAIASALDAAFNHVPLQGQEPLQVIHRDIKPSNAMVNSAGIVKVLDFGTARANFDDREAKTQALAFGSQAYMAPERMMGDQDTAAADIFSLGITLYELLTLERFGKIFIRENRYQEDIVNKFTSVNLGDEVPEEISDELRAFLLRMVSYEPKERPSASEVADQLETLAEKLTDEGLRRFARRVIPDARESLPLMSTNDPLTGSTMIEDASSAFGIPSPSDSSGSWLIDGSASSSMPHPSASTASGSLPVSLPEQENAPTEEPVQKSTGRFVLIGAILAIIIGGGGVGAYFAFSPSINTEDQSQEEVFASGDSEAIPELKKGNYATATLRLNPPGAEVTVTSSLSDFRELWDGTGIKTYANIIPGTYKTKIKTDSTTVRSTLEIEKGKQCVFTFDLTSGTNEWHTDECK